MSSIEVKKPKISPNTIGTHSGTFHCDELLAVFMLQCLPRFQNHELLRSRDLELLDQCDIIVDVGAVFDPAKKRFDHHQSTFQETFSTIRPDLATDFNIRLSSAGLIYMHYGEEVIAEILKKFDVKLTETQMRNVFIKIYKSFIEEIDAIDNGVPQFDGEPKYRINTHLSSRVKRFNGDWMDNKTPAEIDQQFQEAKKYVGEEFLDKVQFFAISWLPARKIVEAAVDRRIEIHESGEILELGRFCPWQEHLRDVEKEVEGLNVKFVVFNSGNDEKTDWRVQAVPVEAGSFVCRKFLNSKWFGVRDSELEAVSGIKGARFVHATGFIGGNQTREGAIEMAIKSLKDD
ncbi:hypothetical protein PVAND_014866 [Polypedilum vanderplanki]|uniref:Uncharacterized protein n=1 Tax=Polypedilum vanderplanki TaxID=319348 RepID=A0A9J6BAZ3_POLVA|nr:hypothetical protein PVAND_014866 [Polypedilum vanderplanki]